VTGSGDPPRVSWCRATSSAAHRGTIVPADARLAGGRRGAGRSVRADRRVPPVTDHPGDAVFSGSIIRQGEISALVYATGADTYFGKRPSWSRTRRRSALPTGSAQDRKFLILLALALVSVIVVVSVLRGDPILTTLQFALVLTVAAIPVPCRRFSRSPWPSGRGFWRRRRPSSPSCGHRGAGWSRRPVFETRRAP